MSPSTSPSHNLAMGRAAAWAGVVVNAALAVIKLAAGIVGHSYALVADAVESLADIFASLVVWRGLTVAARPADEEHPYGHGKAEAIAGLIVVLMLMGAGVLIAMQAVREILTPHRTPAAFTLWVLLGVVVIKEALFRIVARVAQRTGLIAARADAWHHRSDAVTSAAAAIGIGVALYGGERYAQADDWAALFASGVIVFNAYRLARPSMLDLMDAAPVALLHSVRRVAEAVDGVAAIEKLHARKSGAQYWVDMHMEVDPELRVRDAHALAHQVKDAIRNALPQVADVLIHVEPHAAHETGSSGHHTQRPDDPSTARRATAGD